GGSCVGLALTVILAKNGVFAPADLQSDAKTLSDVQPTDAVRSFINYYQCTQGRDGTTTGMSDFQMIYNMSVHLPNVKHGESPFLLTFCCASGGSHGVAAYGLESGVWRYGGKEYDRRILVWDSNYPDALHDDSCLYFNSLTLDFCIPAYGVHVAEGARDNTAGLISARNDLNVLNAYPYQFPDETPGDLNQYGSLTIADAVLLCKHLRAETGLTGRAFRQADLSGDLKVDAVDLTLLKRRMLIP
ncbi:MAG: dockerin type I repeat-containing protein, partial [Oscillospiraceae bacterium]|nr:dockerin type I repeat-containing protein [Oscillospiraceae bacterium]